MLFLSSSALENKPLEQLLPELLKVTNYIELSGGSLHSPNLLNLLLKYKNEKSVNFLIHGYFPPPKQHFLFNFADSSQDTKNFIDIALQYVNALNIPYYSVHTGFKSNFILKNNHLIGGNKEFSLEDIQLQFKWFKRRYTKIKLAFENLYPVGNDKNTCFAQSIDEIIEILELVPEVNLLLDLGHLYISAKKFDFSYSAATKLLFDKFSNRIRELHVSENDGSDDQHQILTPESKQYAILKKYSSLIKNNHINVVIEARKYTVPELIKGYQLIKDVLG